MAATEPKPYTCPDGFFLFVCPFCFGPIDCLSPAPPMPGAPTIRPFGPFEVRVRMHQRCAERMRQAASVAVVKQATRVLLWECRSHLN